MARRLRRFHTAAIRSKPVEIDGHKFPSKAEAKRYGQLKLSQSGGQIRALKVHPRLPMVINGKKIGRGWIELDFSYEEIRDGAWRPVYEDAKGGVDTSLARHRRKVAEAINGITIDVVSMPY